MFARTVSTILIFVCVGCAKGNGGDAPADAGTDAPVTPMSCPAGVIDDMEDGDDSICTSEGRQGYWYVAADGTSADLTPAVNGGFTPMSIPNGRGDSTYAARLTGSGFTGWGALMGLNLNGGNGTYDASAADGIEFWMKSSVAVTFTVTVPDSIPNTSPAGVCEDGEACYQRKFTFWLGAGTTDWVEVQVPFAALRRGAGGSDWDPSELVGIEFVASGSDFDVWVDDIAFYECDGSDCVPSCHDPAFPVACPASEEFPASCWPEDSDCSSLTDVIATTALWGSGPDDLWAVGFSIVSGAGTILNFDGASWSSTIEGTIASQWGVWGSGPDDVWATGERGSIHHFDGSGWSSVPSGTGAMLTNALWGSGPDDVWAAGSEGTIVHFDGTEWSEVESGTTQDIWGIWGADPDDAWAVGSGGTILHWDGDAWSEATSGTTWALDGVWGSAPDDVWAVGESGTTLHWDGSEWTLVDSPTVRFLELVMGSSSDDVWAVGAEGTILHWDGSEWASVESGTTEYLWGLWVVSPTDVWVAGDINTMLRWDGSAWTAVPLAE